MYIPLRHILKRLSSSKIEIKLLRNYRKPVKITFGNGETMPLIILIKAYFSKKSAKKNLLSTWWISLKNLLEIFYLSLQLCKN